MVTVVFSSVPGEQMQKL